ncbi:hypothetical protein ACQKLN_19065 [Paenibacillus glucanolyticus]|uniref:hypothetical protein n=1 Tax=Paenibacillus glucanolyticus TaxID=59843 RepID=UPI000FDBD255
MNNPHGKELAPKTSSKTPPVTPPPTLAKFHTVVRIGMTISTLLSPAALQALFAAALLRRRMLIWRWK